MVINSPYMNHGEGMNFISDSNASPTTSLGDLTNNTGVDMLHSFTFLVPNNHYFKMTQTGGTVSSNNRTWDAH